ncbi:MAG: hypothetical protein JJ899_06270 [Alphaproteobacteria bacterium]|nr:hypothetical protein [Alphaproteobacteria bacterium]
MADDGHSNGAYQMITPPNLLKAKVGGSDGPSGIDLDAIQQAASAVESLADEFEERVSLEIAMLMKLSHDLDETPDTAGKVGKRARRVGHEVGGQGATYGFDLLSDIGLSLTRYVDELDGRKRMSGEVLRAHADAMRAIIKNDIRGDGGVVGSELLESLEQMVDRMI